jgi:hypothetical protein
VGCYVMIAPLVIVLVAACCNHYERGWRKFAQWWMVVFYTIVLAI